MTGTVAAVRALLLARDEHDADSPEWDRLNGEVNALLAVRRAGLIEDRDLADDGVDDPYGCDGPSSARSRLGPTVSPAGRPAPGPARIEFPGAVGSAGGRSCA